MLEQNYLSLSYKLPRSLPHATAFLGGLLLMFSWTSLSPIDILAIPVALVTVLHIMRKQDIRWVLEKRTIILLLFAALVSFQLFLYPLQNPVPALITLYLIGACLCIHYWTRTYPNILAALAYGYVLGVVLSSVLGFLAYVVRLVTEERIILPLFWMGDIRLAGFFDDPNIYGAYLVPALVLLLWVCVMHSSGRVLSVFLYLSLFSVYTNILLSGSRGAWLNAAVALIVVAIVFHKEYLARFRTFFVLGSIAFLVAVVLIFLLPVRDGRTFFDYSLATRKQSSDIPRFENLQAAPQRVVDRNAAEIVIGSGTGSYQESSPGGLAAHNTYLTVIYEQGVLGLVFLFLYLLIPSRKLRLQLTKTTAVLLVAVLLGMVAEGFYIDILHWRHFWVLLAFI